MLDIKLNKKIEIEKKVNEILSESGYNPFPKEDGLIVDIVRLVKGYDFAVQTSEMNLDITGCLLVNDFQKVMNTNKNRLIVVNKFLSNSGNDECYMLKKSRLITAHEYAHFVLHKKDGQPIYAHRNINNCDNPIELEADYFARAILMPIDIFKRYVSTIDELNLFDNKIDAIKILSTVFKVTKDKVEKRQNDINELKGYI